jgi:glycerol-3-phosphate acyltransferase PlsY
MSAWLVALVLVPFYLLGSFPTGFLLAKLRGIDITQQGSGNVGATNVARVLGKKFGILTLGGDLFKGCLGVLIARVCGASDIFVAAVAVALVFGHCFSIPPLLRGGKGVATALGVILALEPVLALVAVGVFGAVFAAWRIVSLASISAALLVPGVALMCGYSDHIAMALVVIGLTLVARHEENIKRLIEGREPAFSSKQKES